MKVEIVIKPNILEEIVSILKNTGTLCTTKACCLGINVSGAFPHTDKIKLSTHCNEKQKGIMMVYFADMIAKQKGVYSLSCH